jgi:hypothetical protein
MKSLSPTQKLQAEIDRLNNQLRAKNNTLSYVAMEIRATNAAITESALSFVASTEKMGEAKLLMARNAKLLTLVGSIESNLPV